MFRALLTNSQGQLPKFHYKIRLKPPKVFLSVEEHIRRMTGIMSHRILQRQSGGSYISKRIIPSQ